MSDTVLVWFRRDLRLADNPALYEASRSGSRVIGLYIHEQDQGIRPPGAAARWWLHRSLNVLARELSAIGIPLEVRSGVAREIVLDTVQRHRVRTLLCNRRYGPSELPVDAEVAKALETASVLYRSLPGNVLVEPWDLLTVQGRPYSVFTPYWNALKKTDIPRPLPQPETLGPREDGSKVDEEYDEPAWARKLARHWTIGEEAARQALAQFLDERLIHYPDAHDVPAASGTSRLSPHLRCGEISARQVWHAVTSLGEREPEAASAVTKFLSELAWRDFNNHQLYHRADIATIPMQAKFDALRWRRDEDALARWRNGLTGFPIVDAGMRELWETGFMQNRVRMLAASLLCKTLLIDWREGEAWFWDCLVDADPANNPGNWQWVAGSGLDASPFFRIFNPITQGEKFDADGRYARHWVPELARLPDKWLHRPYEAPAEVLASANVVLGQTYPRPLADLGLARQRALEAFRLLGRSAHADNTG